MLDGRQFVEVFLGGCCHFAKASAREFSALGMCLTRTSTNFLSNSRTFLRYRIIFFPLAS